METIHFDNLAIGNGGKPVMAGINACVQSGELTCLIGRNGTGKSTLLRTIAGFQQPLEGRIMYGEQDLQTIGNKERARLIGVVLTEKPDVQNMTVREVVALGRMPYTGFFGVLSKDDWKTVDKAIATVKIESLAQRLIGSLSDGERQKVMVAKALAQQTPIILLDEPTAFLDYPSKVELMQTLRLLAKKMDKTIVLSTHDIELALEYADRFLVMESSMHVKLPSEISLQSFLNDAGNVAAY